VAERPNGLASLADARQRARRAMPPPRHPVARPPDPSEDSSHEATAEAGDQRPAVPSGPAERHEPTGVAAATRLELARDAGHMASHTVVEPPVKLTLYLDQDIDRYLEDVRIQGLTAQPRVDVSRSAVVRLALRRLRSEMTPDQVKSLLAAQPTNGARTGRKRR